MRIITVFSYFIICASQEFAAGGRSLPVLSLFDVQSTALPTYIADAPAGQVAR